MLPGTILYVYVGSVAKDLTELTSGDIQSGMAGRAPLLVGLAATLVLTILITRKGNPDIEYASRPRVDRGWRAVA